MYSLGGGGGVGQKFPNDEKNFRIYHGILSHEYVCYSENEDAIYKQKDAYFTYRSSAVGSFCLLGAENGGPRKFLNFESLKCHFLDFGEVLTEC
jgi:hypothetical protein